MRKFYLTMGLASAAILSSTLAGAQLSLEEGQKAHQLRQSLFKLLSYNSAALNGMARGNIEFDADKAELHAKRIEVLARMIPEATHDTRGSGAYTRAMDTVWDNWDTYVEFSYSLELAAQHMREAAASGDVRGVRQHVRTIGQACGMCHDLFRFHLSDPGFPFRE